MLSGPLHIDQDSVTDCVRLRFNYIESIIMDIKSLAVSMVAKKLGMDSGGGAMEQVVGSLIGNGDSMDIGSLVSGLQSKGLGDVASSWLGDGANAEISADQLKDVIGGDKLSAAAAQLGANEGDLLEGLRSALPQVVDKASGGGSLLDAAGGLGGLAGMAKKLF